MIPVGSKLKTDVVLRLFRWHPGEQISRDLLSIEIERHCKCRHQYDKELHEIPELSEVGATFTIDVTEFTDEEEDHAKDKTDLTEQDQSSIP